MLDQQRRRAAVEHVEGGTGARVDLEKPPARLIDETIGAGQTGEAGGPHQPPHGLGDLRGDRGRNRPRLVAAAGERPGIAERPQGRRRLPLLGERQRLDPAAIGQEVQGDGAAGHSGLEVVTGRGGAGRSRADMRTAAAARLLQEPCAAIGDRAGADRRMRDREPLAQGRETERLLQGGDRPGAGAEQAVAGGDRGHQFRRALEAAAEDDAEFTAARRLRKLAEPRQHGRPVAAASPEAAGQGAVALGRRERVLVAEQVEHVRPQARPPRGLGQCPAGLGCDQDRAALTMRKRAQPAISTARV